jgi:hypothetical protein
MLRQLEVLLMRTITDAAGVEWTIFEVRREGQANDQWSYLPEGFGDGWLCFESRFSKRSLTPVPANWEDVGADALSRMLQQAAPVRSRRTGAEDRAEAE